MSHNDLMNYAFVLALEPMKRHMAYNAEKRVIKLQREETNKWVSRWADLADALETKNLAECSRLLEAFLNKQ